MMAGGDETLLSLQGIHKSFGPVQVLRDVSCGFRAGEVHCLMGENGAGKSTLIRIVSGAYAPDLGSVILAGKTLGPMTPRSARDRGIATIYQELDLIPNLDGAENMFLGREPRGRFGRIDRTLRLKRARAVLDSMQVSVPLDRPVQELGVAQQQMIAIAKSITDDCRIMILDEPTAVFTRTETDSLFGLVRKLREQGIAILFMSHHMEEIFEIGDHITVLRDGTVASSGAIATYDHDKLVRDMVGREVKRSLRRSAPTSIVPLLEVRGLGDGKTVHDISFSIGRGEIVGMAGLIGSGRTEIARLIFGAEQLRSGEILLDGKAVRPTDPFHAVTLGIGMVPEDRKRDGLVLTRSVGENAGYTLVRKWSRLGRVPWRRVRAEVDGQTKALAVRPASLGALVARLSGGNQQKVVLSRWLAAGVSLLILDEPTRGVDIGARSEIYAVIRSLAERGLAILLISSDLSEILSQSDRILVMAKGHLAGELPGEGATEEAIMALAFQTRPVTIQ
jgi:ribose transport system ATP-binding protein